MTDIPAGVLKDPKQAYKHLCVIQESLDLAGIIFRESCCRYARRKLPRYTPFEAIIHFQGEDVHAMIDDVDRQAHFFRHNDGRFSCITYRTKLKSGRWSKTVHCVNYLMADHITVAPTKAKD